MPRHPAPRRHDPRLVAHQPVQDRRRGRAPARPASSGLGIDALIAIGGEDTLGVAAKLHRARRERRRRAEDHRQRPVGHRAHLRLRHRGADRHRGHRPAAHHRRVAPPGDGRRGHGPPRRPDRPARASPAAPTSSSSPRSPSTSTRCATRCSAATPRATSPPSSWSPRAPRPKEGTMELVSGEIDQFGHVRLGGIGNRLAEAIEDRTGFETRLTILGHVQRGGTPDRLRPGARHPLRRRPPSTPCTTAPSARWWPSRRGEIVRVPAQRGRRHAQDRRPRALPRRRRGLLRRLTAGPRRAPTP